MNDNDLQSVMATVHLDQVHSNPDRAVGGTGLGLVICKALCESMGGKIDCRSAPGQGTTVRFSVLVGVDSPTSTVSLSGDKSCEAAALAGMLDDGAPRLSTGSNRFRSPVDSSAGFAEQGDKIQRTRAPGMSSGSEWRYKEVETVKAPLQHVGKESGTSLGLQPPQKGQRLYLKQSPQWQPQWQPQQLQQQQQYEHQSRRVSPKAHSRSSVVKKNRHGWDSRAGHTVSVTAIAAPSTSESRSDDNIAGCHHHHLPIQTDPREKQASFNKTVVDTDGNRLGKEAAVVVAEITPFGSAQVVRRQPRFLVVDDQRINRLLVRKMLKGLDAHVREEEDGAKVHAPFRVRASV